MGVLFCLDLFSDCNKGIPGPFFFFSGRKDCLTMSAKVMRASNLLV